MGEWYPWRDCAPRGCNVGNVPGGPGSRNIRLPVMTHRRTPRIGHRSEIACEMSLRLDDAVRRRRLIAAGFALLLGAAAGPSAAEGIVTLAPGQAAIVFMVAGQGRTGD